MAEIRPDSADPGRGSHGRFIKGWKGGGRPKKIFKSSADTQTAICLTDTERQQTYARLRFIERRFREDKIKCPQCGRTESKYFTYFVERGENGSIWLLCRSCSYKMELREEKDNEIYILPLPSKLSPEDRARIARQHGKS